MPSHTNHSRGFVLALSVVCSFSGIVSPLHGAVPAEVTQVFEKYCGDCHAGGANEGSLALDELLAVSDATEQRKKWVAVWKNLRAQMMPPADQPQPTPEEKRQLLAWIEQDAFQLNRASPDPGRVTIRRLNRAEYRFTVLDLFGVDFDTNDAFPADDTGYGFDTIGDVLSLSPLQVEKYLEAARDITGRVVPINGPQPPTTSISPDSFRDPKEQKRTARSLPYAQGTTVVRQQRIEHAGPYDLTWEYRLTGPKVPTAERATLILRIDGEERARRELGWDTSNAISLSFSTTLDVGTHAFELELAPLSPAKDGETNAHFELRRLDLRGPTDGSQLAYQGNARRIMFKGLPPKEAVARQAYTRQILRHFADRAFRRPVDEETLDFLVTLAEETEARSKDAGFEKGLAEALTAVLVSPRFLFRAEVQPEPDNAGQVVPLDEYALASRLSYFLWRSLPDDQLFDLAAKKQLRAQLRPQIDRMLADAKSRRFVESFVGQWLQTRDVETKNVDARRILGNKSVEEALELFNRNLRRAMREETDLLFAHLLQENRPAIELLTADYTFLNENLAEWYGIEGVKGREMRKVDLPDDSVRGGVLSQAAFLIVTSNPTRTSPVKRGLFVLDNLLGSPAPPPPPDVPPLEESRSGKRQKLTMRELMEKHRADALCASCHARMDPLGLSLEEFDALGRWRREDAGQPIDTAGKLITGESFGDVRELSEVIANQRRQDFYACLTEKMLTYAIGRGVEYYDVPAVETIVERLNADEGRIRTLLYEIAESAPFQLRRGDGSE